MHLAALMPWWGWFFAAGISAMITFAAARYQDERGRPLPIIAGAVFAIAALVCGLISIVLFVKWMWFS